MWKQDDKEGPLHALPSSNSGKQLEKKSALLINILRRKWHLASSLHVDVSIPQHIAFFIQPCLQPCRIFKLVALQCTKVSMVVKYKRCQKISQ